MPPVGAAVATAAFSAAAGTTVFGLSIATSAAVVFGGSLALSFLQEALAPKPDIPDFGSFNSIRATGVTQQFSQPVTERRMIYGEQRVSGPVVYAGVTDNNRYLHLVIALASHPCEEIGEIMIDEESIPLDAIDSGGNVTSGRYTNHLRVKKHLGSNSQVADADLVAEVDEWTSNHRLQGITYVYLRYKWNREKFPSGIPNFSAWVKGKNDIVDPRDSSTGWTPNLALCTRDYLMDTTFGMGAALSAVDDTQAQASGNTCEEIVATTEVDSSIASVDTTNNIISLDGDALLYQTGDRVQLATGTIGGLSLATDYYVIVYQRVGNPRVKLATSLANALAGTEIDLTSGTTGTLRKVGEPRYFGGGVLKSNSERGNNLRELYVSMAGQLVYAGGVWRILAGEYQTPTLSFSETDLLESIKVQTKVSKRDRFNRVQGIYISPLFDGNPSDYPAVSNTTYETEDGGVIKTDLDLSFCQRPTTAQRIAKIYLERMRQEIVFSARFDISAFQLQVGDNFYFTLDRYGWSNKVFEVIDWRLGVQDGVPYVELSCRENSSSVYDWNNGEETAVDPAPNTSLPTPFVVPVVGGFSLDSIASSTLDGDTIYNIVASWELPDDQFVVSGGRYEVRFKEVDQTAYISAGFVDGSINQLRLTALQPDTLYDVEIIAYNDFGIPSQPTVLEDFLVGTSITTDTEDWENETFTAQDWETDSLTAEDWEV